MGFMPAQFSLNYPYLANRLSVSKENTIIFIHFDRGR